jgi:hypothetical protein|tara:strand:- start:19497 stop:19817 length:321 start_codon:yes stop_codon:yes gene_type:complete
MRKPFFILFLLFVYTWSWSIFNVAKADDYNTKVISHVISEKIKGTDIDTSYIMEQEIERLAHKFLIDSVNILQAYLPQIIEGVAADLRLKLDEEYKKEILNGENDN